MEDEIKICKLFSLSHYHGVVFHFQGTTKGSPLENKKGSPLKKGKDKVLFIQCRQVFWVR